MHVFQSIDSQTILGIFINDRMNVIGGSTVFDSVLLNT